MFKLTQGLRSLVVLDDELAAQQRIPHRTLHRPFPTLLLIGVRRENVNKIEIRSFL